MLSPFSLIPLVITASVTLISFNPSIHHPQLYTDNVPHSLVVILEDSRQHYYERRYELVIMDWSYGVISRKKERDLHVTTPVIQFHRKDIGRANE